MVGQHVFSAHCTTTWKCLVGMTSTPNGVLVWPRNWVQSALSPVSSVTWHCSETNLGEESASKCHLQACTPNNWQCAPCATTHQTSTNHTRGKPNHWKCPCDHFLCCSNGHSFCNENLSWSLGIPQRCASKCTNCCGLAIIATTATGFDWPQSCDCESPPHFSSWLSAERSSCDLDLQAYQVVILTCKPDKLDPHADPRPVGPFAVGRVHTNGAVAIQCLPNIEEQINIVEFILIELRGVFTLIKGFPSSLASCLHNENQVCLSWRIHLFLCASCIATAILKNSKNRSWAKSTSPAAWDLCCGDVRNNNMSANLHHVHSK